MSRVSDNDISSDNPFVSRSIRVLESEMAFIETGRGTPIIFVHGNPTSSYIWRNVIPHVAEFGRCLAPDLIGMGRSGKIEGFGYRFTDHAIYYAAWLDAMVPAGEIIFVVQDWGAALTFDWANRNRDRVKAICYMEAMVQPRQWADLPADYAKTFKSFRTEKGFQKAITDNVFVEKVLPNGVARKLSTIEMDTYRAPYEEVEHRTPTVQWPREIPFDGKPADNHLRVQAYADWLSESTDLPKLFVDTTDGHALLGRNREFCREWPNQEEITLSGKHYIQEDAPAELGAAIADWIGRL